MAKHTKLSPLSLTGIVITIVGLALTVYAITQSTEFRQRASEGAILYITGTPESITKGQDFTVSLDVQTQSIPVQTATVVLIYPQNKLTVKKLDFNKSTFDMVGENIHSNGYIQVSRDASSPVNGKSHIMTIHFVAKDAVDLSEIKPVNGTAIISTENKNIYTNAVSRKEMVEEQSSVFSLQSIIQFFRSLFGLSLF